MSRVLLLFLDGVGIGEADAATNPFVAASLPCLRSLLEGDLPVSGARRAFAHATLAPLDTLLGVPGLPQSGTGQAALLGGFNAVAEHGRHFGPWVPAALRERLGAESVLARARRAGYDVAFANAYPEEVLQAAEARRVPAFLRAGPPVAARAAGLLTRHTDALERGDAVASEITNDAWIERLGRRRLPRITPRTAGENLARIAGAHDLTLFAHYGTDTVGHEGDMAGAIEALERVDAFLAGLLAAAEPGLVTLVVSDHGNIEDVRAGHTTNPAFGLVIGSGHEQHGRALAALTDVAPLVLSLLGA